MVYKLDLYVSFPQGSNYKGAWGGLTLLIKTWTPQKEVKTTGRGPRYTYISILPLIVYIASRPGEDVDPPDCHWITLLFPPIIIRDVNNHPLPFYPQ